MAVANTIPVPHDTPEARRYNRLRRWLGVADLVLGLALLVVLLLTGWTGTLRDVAYRAADQHYALAVFFYVGMLLVISKALGFALDFYGFRLEHHYQLSNQKLGGWLLDEFKGWLVGLVLASILAEILYFCIRESPQHWWIAAWLIFIGLFIFFAQIAPVVFLPIFYKFEPLENEGLKARLVRLSEQ